MQIQTLLIGTGYDGPSETPVHPVSIDDAFEMFGGFVYTNVTLGAADTFFTLPSAADSVEFYTYDEYGNLVEYTDITTVSVVGTDVTIERLGVSASLVVKYRRAISPGDPYVFKGFAEVNSTVGSDGVFVYRLGGTQATLTLGLGGSQVIFRSVYGGALYNSATIIADSTKIAIVPPPGKGPTKYYTFTGKTCEDIATAVNTDYMKGRGVILASSTGAADFEIDPGTYQFSNGDDGSWSDQAVIDMVQTLQLDNVTVVSILGKLARSSTGATDTLSQFLLLDDSSTPTAFVQGVEYTSADQLILSPAYAAQLAAAKTISDPRIFLVVGEAEYTYGPDPYWDSPAPIFASQIGRSPGGVAYQPSKALMRPIFKDTDIEALSAGGYSAYSTSVSKGFVVYSESTSNPKWCTARWFAYLAAVSVVDPIMDSVIGKTSYSIQELEQQIQTALGNLNLYREYSTSITRIGYDKLQVSIFIRPYGTIAAIQFGVTVNASF